MAARQLRPGVRGLGRADDLRRAAAWRQGYKEASVEIERKLRELWEWLVDVHALGRPSDATPPG